MEERRKPDEKFNDFLEKLFKLESAVQRLTEHEKLDRPKYDEWHKDVTDRLIELEKMHLEKSNGRLRELENRPIVVQLTAEEIKKLFNEWIISFAGQLFFKLFLSVTGALGFIIAVAIAAIAAYFKFR